VGKNVLEFWDFGTTDVQNQSGMIKSGRDPGRGFNSYSYHMPFPYKNSPTTIISTNPITSSSNPAKAIMADRSPFWDYVNASTNKAAGLYGWKSCAVAPDTMPKGNSANHQKEGQNVLFVDQHVKFEKGANCGIELDNIYTTWGYKASEAQITGDACTSRARYKQCGFGALDSGDSTSQGMPGPGNDSTVNYVPQDDEDNYLVNEFN
jgi:hypothetical protein